MLTRRAPRIEKSTSYRLSEARQSAVKSVYGVAILVRKGGVSGGTEEWTFQVIISPQGLFELRVNFCGEEFVLERLSNIIFSIPWAALFR